MSDPVWYRSLYWRITFGFIALLAMVLLVQTLLFLWLTDRFVGTSRPPSELARYVATEVGTELERNPGVKLEDFVPSRFSHIFQPFLVVLRDGQRASNRPTSLPFEFGRTVQSRLRNDPARRGPSAAGPSQVSDRIRAHHRRRRGCRGRRRPGESAAGVRRPARARADAQLVRARAAWELARR